MATPNFSSPLPEMRDTALRMRDTALRMRDTAPTVLVLPFPGDREQLLPLRRTTPTQLLVLKSSWAAGPGERQLVLGRGSWHGQATDQGCHQGSRGGGATARGP